MAFVKKTWTDRIAEYINRRRLDHEDGSSELVTVAREEGTVSQEGDAFSAENMNDLEQRVADEFGLINEDLTQLNSKLDDVGTVTEFNWLSSTIAGSGQATEKKALPAGAYVLVLQTGYVKDVVTATFGIYDETHKRYICSGTQVNNSYNTISTIAKFEEDTIVYGRNYSTSAVTFEATNIAGMKAIRIL